jgi:hypothetical protein
MSGRRTFLALALLVSAAGTGAAAEEAASLPPFKAINYPLEIRKALSYGPDECKRQGGSKATFAPDTVRKVDLNGDGVDDYIISYRKTECAGANAVYCGTAGCTTEIYVTLSGGRQRLVFSDRVWDIEFLPGEGARTLRFQMHGSYCGGPGAMECHKEHKITTRPFRFIEPE